MKNIILAVVVLLVLLIGGGIFYVVTNLDGIVKDAIEVYGSNATQTAVRVDDVDISLAQGRATIRGLTVANPQGFANEHALELGSITVQLDTEQAGQDVLVFKAIDVSAPHVFYEMSASSQDNLRTLKQNVASSAGTSKADQTSTDDPAPLLSIRQFNLADATLEADIVPLDEHHELTLSGFSLQNLGGTEGAPPDAIARQVLDQILDKAVARVRQEGMDQLRDRAREELEEKAADKLKDRLGIDI